MPKENETIYLLKGIPKDMYRRAQAKAAANKPPLSIRWVLITLLEKWVGPAPADESAPTKAPKASKAKTPKAAAKLESPVVGSTPVDPVEPTDRQTEGGADGFFF